MFLKIFTSRGLTLTFCLKLTIEGSVSVIFCISSLFLLCHPDTKALPNLPQGEECKEGVWNNYEL